MRAAGMTLALAAGLNGCAMVGTAYDAATSVLVDYCAQPPVVRMATQIVISGRAYDHSVCDLVSEAGASQALIVAAAEAVVDGEGADDE